MRCAGSSAAAFQNSDKEETLIRPPWRLVLIPLAALSSTWGSLR